MHGFFLRLRMTFQAVLASESGQDLPEYALAMVMIALGTVAGTHSIAGGVNQVFSTLANILNTSV